MKITCLMAQTLDGRIAKDADHFPDWTEKADKKFFMETTKAAGVMVFGRTTFETLPGVLPGRLHIVMSRKAGDWDEREPNVVFTNKTPSQITTKLKELTYQHIIVAGGAITNSLWIEAGLIDELLVTISPVLFGEGIGVFKEGVEINLELTELDRIGENTLVAKYAVIR